jgi:hypothetical protein
LVQAQANGAVAGVRGPAAGLFVCVHCLGQGD